MDIDFKALGKRVASRRKELGIKQCDLAEKADISNNYLSNIECGRSIPSLDTLASLCICLDTSPDYFLLGTVKTYDIPNKIVENIKLCNEDDLEIIDGIVEFLIKRNNS